MASDLIEAYTDENGVVKDEELIADTTGAIYIGGSETTASVLLTFIFAMLHTPDVQARAQAEIDRVTGGTRLPTFEDRDSLPYVRALIDECLRYVRREIYALKCCISMADCYSLFVLRTKIDGTQSVPLGFPIGLLKTMYTRGISCQKAQSFSRTNGELS